MHTCCKPVKDFLDYSRELHREIQACYDTLNAHAEQPRIKMLLDYLSRHERNMEENLHRFEDSTRKEILNMWLEHVPRLNIQEIIGQCQIREGMSLEEIVEAALALDAAMLGLYRDVAGHAKDARVKAVFENIVHMEENTANQTLRDASALREM